MNIIEEIRQEIKATYREPTNRDLNLLALLFLIIPGIIGLYVLLWKGSHSGWYWIGVGGTLALSRAIKPLFAVIYRLWLGFSVVLGYFVSRILLTLIFLIAVVPVGLLMRIVGRDPMNRKFDPEAPSYWIKREPESDVSIARYEKQF
ncbi:MAG: SxtJ family membrane protein [Pseudomonadota bacterium]